MRWAVNPDGVRVHAQPDGRGTCPACRAVVYAKCGDQVEWHWAHAVGEGADCELGEGLDADEHTGWHDALQTFAQLEGATIEATHPTKKRRADIRTPTGLVIELQHSRIDPDVVHGREADWLPEGPMIWLWDAAKWESRGTWHAGIRLPAKPLVVGRTPIFLDRGDQVEQITAIGKQASTDSYEVMFGPVGWNVYQFIDRCIHGKIPDTWYQPPIRMGAEAKHPFRPDGTPGRPYAPPTYDNADAFRHDPVRFCAAPSFDGTFSGPKCGLTATAGSIYCWAHLATFEQEAG